MTHGSSMFRENEFSVFRDRNIRFLALFSFIVLFLEHQSIYVKNGKRITGIRTQVLGVSDGWGGP